LLLPSCLRKSPRPSRGSATTSCSTTSSILWHYTANTIRMICRRPAPCLPRSARPPVTRRHCAHPAKPSTGGRPC